MSLHFWCHCIIWWYLFASLTTVVSDNTDSSQMFWTLNHLSTLSVFFLVSWETTRTCSAFLHESNKEGFLLLYRSFNLKGSDSCMILRRGRSCIDGRCRLFTIFLVLLRLCHQKMINLPNVQNFRQKPQVLWKFCMRSIGHNPVWISLQNC